MSSYKAYRLAVVLMASLFFLLVPYGLLRAFTNDPEMICYGILYMKIAAFAQIPLP